MGTKWRVWSSAGEKCVLLYHRKGNAIQYAALYVHSFLFLCPQKIVDSEKFHFRFSTPEELKTTADKLRYYRYQKSLLQREVAAYAGINESTYIDYESGKRDYYPFAQIQRIARLLKVPTEALLDDYNLFLCEQGKALKALRENCHWTQSEFAQALSTKLHSVKQWEQEKVRMTRKMWVRFQSLLKTKE